MPIYEYWCQPCKKKFELLVLRPKHEPGPTCPGCGGAELKRLISRFATPKSEEARMEALTDPSNLSGLDENDPASMARWLKRMGSELGEDVQGDEIDQMVDEIGSDKGLDDMAAGSPEPALDVPDPTTPSE